MILVDTREQKPLWDPEFYDVKKRKLNEGDYTTEELYNIAHIERKSGIDFYGSIIQNHDRFRKEIERAAEKNLAFAIFVECPSEMFFRKRFAGGYRLKCPRATLRKIVRTIQDKYDLEIVWCESRDDMRERMLLWFVNQKKKLKQKNGKITTNKKTE